MLENKKIEEASRRLEGVAKRTPLQFSERLSSLYDANVYIKREDLQKVRSYKIRGAYNFIKSVYSSLNGKSVVCVSAGNHAQGVALSASLLNVKAHIFMPVTTPQQKVGKVEWFGGDKTNITLVGSNYDESFQAASDFCKKTGSVFVHPFDNETVIAGQGTVGKEVLEQCSDVDYVLCPVGGGGLISGVASYLKSNKEGVKVIGAEPQGAAGMCNSLEKGEVSPLQSLDPFVDGAAVRKVGETGFGIVSRIVDDVCVVEEGKVCSTMIELYQSEGIIAEPAGALSISVLDNIKEEIKGKTVVCVLSGGNNDIMRYPEIMEKSLIYQGRKHYFIIKFTQKPGQLKKFVNEALGPTDDIVRFEYMKKNSKDAGPALVGIELLSKEDYDPLVSRMKELGMDYVEVKEDDMLYNYLI